MGIYDNLQSAMASALINAVKGGKPLKYQMGGKIVDNTGLVQALTAAQAAAANVGDIYYDSMDDELDINGVDTTEYIDDND